MAAATTTTRITSILRLLDVLLLPIVGLAFHHHHHQRQYQQYHQLFPDNHRPQHCHQQPFQQLSSFVSIIYPRHHMSQQPKLNVPFVVSTQFIKTQLITTDTTTRIQSGLSSTEPLPSSSSLSSPLSQTTTTSIIPTIVDRSNLLLLEHININIPQHQPSLFLYVELLGMGLDPRRAANVVQEPDGSGTTTTIWTNCGPCQFHLPYGPIAQCIPGHIGLRYDTLEPLKQRILQYQQIHASSLSSSVVSKQKDLFQFVIGTDRTGREYIQVTDPSNGNIFYCRVKKRPLTFQQHLKQPLVKVSDTDQYGWVATKYGIQQQDNDHLLPSPLPNDEKEKGSIIITTTSDDDDKYRSECRGIDYVEFHCPMDTAERIALFYQRVLNATTHVMVIDDSESQDDDDDKKEEENDDNQKEMKKLKNVPKIAIVAFGDIDEHGQAEQNLIFREVVSSTSSSSSSLSNHHSSLSDDGQHHHIALYIGETTKQFEEVLERCLLLDLVWVNPRFKDNTTDVIGARYWKQFRFKDIIDLSTGDIIFQLEHEVRCVEHEAWPGTSS